MWHAIALSAEARGHINEAKIARNISYSLMAAGIRLRDASDNYNIQLITRFKSCNKNMSHFSNIPMQDIEIAFHSVLSELASTRDYIATFFAAQLGASSKIDALSRLQQWVKKNDDIKKTPVPVIDRMLQAYDEHSQDPWLAHLTNYRNNYIHRQPLGSCLQNQERFLTYETVEFNNFIFPRILMPLPISDPYNPRKDALTVFSKIYKSMIDFAQFAATQTIYDRNYIPTYTYKK